MNPSSKCAHQRVGHVFQGRYKAILVERDSYLLELARFIVLNPVLENANNLKGDPGYDEQGVGIGQPTILVLDPDLRVAY